MRRNSKRPNGVMTAVLAMCLGDGNLVVPTDEVHLVEDLASV